MSFRIRGSTQFILLLIFFLTIVSGVVADSDCAADPYADPANDPCNPLKYVPSNVLTALALGRNPLINVDPARADLILHSLVSFGCLNTDFHDMEDRRKVYVNFDHR